jgi:transcriptional regulator with XRE-family HTH domain
MYSELVGALVRHLREEQRLTQVVGASMVGVSTSTYSRYESGDCTLNVVDLYKICIDLGKTQVEFLTQLAEIEAILRSKKISVFLDEKSAEEGMIHIHGKTLRNVLTSWIWER